MITRVPGYPERPSATPALPSSSQAGLATFRSRTPTS